MFTSEIIETLQEGDGELEVCATAETQYDSSAQRVSVALDSFARCLSASGSSEHVSRAWLPAAEQVTEYLSHDEATAFAKDVFQSWVRTVHAAIPHKLRSTT